ncbi:Phage-related tail fiber protein (modular protein) [Xenorhabdus bovienii str. oregonense]|uniref:Phage-related tail fiber protein (Modular protein) n=1 Tax=Xenorhabdus bovienii str. oregonense TaxID=1398202 RepID=A0A077NZ93_XENBV|nr:hypothetical protein [Xenorhabdus bovienii]CDH07562.1 Phage-related tail fiber protein (modular protein) [Xenorhabdus bovienii str. oregonense]
MTKIFKIPFAAQGDRVSIPNEVQPDGAVSYTQGYGYDYERDQNTDPAAKDIEREKMNGMFHDITHALGEMQVYGMPRWNSEALPYPLRAVVYHHHRIWQSRIENNKEEPKKGIEWAELKADLTADDVGAYNKEEANQRFQPLGNYTPAGYSYGKEESDNRFQPKGNYQPVGNYALKGESYTKPESDGKYQPMGNYLVAGYSYSKDESDSRYQPKGNYAPAGNYALKGESYTKGDSDSKYQPKGNYQPTGNYAVRGESYTKGESDGKYQPRGNYQPSGNYQPAGNYAVRGECYTRGESDSRYLKSSSGNRVRVWSGGSITNGTIGLSRNVLGKTLYCYDPNQNWYYTVTIPAPNIDIFTLSGTGWIAIRLNSAGTTLTISRTEVTTSAIDIYE